LQSDWNGENNQNQNQNQVSQSAQRPQNQLNKSGGQQFETPQLNIDDEDDYEDSWSQPKTNVKKKSQDEDDEWGDWEEKYEPNWEDSDFSEVKKSEPEKKSTGGDTKTSKDGWDDTNEWEDF
jgi:hypothetical protein